MTRWPSVQLRRILRLEYGDGLADTARLEGNVPVFGSNGRVGSHDVANTEGPVIVVGRKGSFGKVQFSPEPVFAIDTTYFVDRRSTNADLRWLFYVLLTLRLDELSEDVGVPGLSRERAHAIRVAHSPLSDQRAIAGFLDAETGRIDGLIEKKRLMIELVDQRLAAQLGDEFHHLDVYPQGRLGRHAKVLSGAGFPHDYQGRSEGDYPFFKVGDFARPANRIELVSCDNWVAEADRIALGARLAPPGSILFPKVGAALLGNQRRVATVPSAFDNNVMAVVPETLLPRFAHFVLTQIDLGELANPGPVPSVNEDVVKALRVPLPDVGQQAHIVERVRLRTDFRDQISQKLNRQIELLQEHRQALITAAVTGRLDIGKVAA